MQESAEKQCDAGGTAAAAEEGRHGGGMMQTG